MPAKYILKFGTELIMEKTILISVFSIIVSFYNIFGTFADTKYFDANGNPISESEYQQIEKQRNNVLQKSIPDNSIKKSEPVKNAYESKKDKEKREKQEDTIRLQKEEEEYQKIVRARKLVMEQSKSASSAKYISSETEPKTKGEHVGHVRTYGNGPIDSYDNREDFKKAKDEYTENLNRAQTVTRTTGAKNPFSELSQYRREKNVAADGSVLVYSDGKKTIRQSVDIPAPEHQPTPPKKYEPWTPETSPIKKEDESLRLQNEENERLRLNQEEAIRVQKEQEERIKKQEETLRSQKEENERLKKQQEETIKIQKEQKERIKKQEEKRKLTEAILQKEQDEHRVKTNIISIIGLIIAFFIYRRYHSIIISRVKSFLSMIFHRKISSNSDKCPECSQNRQPNETHCQNCGIKYEKYQIDSQNTNTEETSIIIEELKTAEGKPKAEEVPKIQEEPKTEKRLKIEELKKDSLYHGAVIEEEYR